MRGLRRTVAAVVLVIGATVAGVAQADVVGATPAVTTTTSAPATTTTTIAGIVGQVPTAPSTVPLRTHATSATLDPNLARYSEIAFGVVAILALVQFLLTRPGRRGRWTL